MSKKRGGLVMAKKAGRPLEHDIDHPLLLLLFRQTGTDNVTDVERVTGISNGTLRHWSQHRSSPLSKLEMVAKLIEWTGLTLEELIELVRDYESQVEEEARRAS
ncbi:MAG: hypothetical protein K2X93_00105 [Candidatus Obscuribacterales bacterium]|nr:hypothetical protein [Candidatus Obscuribacterales bacterium]